MHISLIVIQVLYLVIASVASYYLENKRYRLLVFTALIFLSSYTAVETIKFQHKLINDSDTTVARTGNLQKISGMLIEHTGKLVQNIEAANDNLDNLRKGFDRLGADQQKLFEKSETINTNLEKFVNRIESLDRNIHKAKDDIDTIIQQNNNLKSIIEYFDREFPLTKDKLVQIVSLSNQAQLNFKMALENQDKLIKQGQNIEYSMADFEKSMSKIDAVYNFVTHIQSIKTSDRLSLISMVGEIKGSMPNISRTGTLPASPQNIRIAE